MQRWLIVAACWLAWLPATWPAADWQTFANCQLEPGDANDGDSFLVKAGEQQIHIRLYFVDCPETTTSSDADAKRVREQARHFGLTNPARVVHYGKAARVFTDAALAKPFTVRTTFATALGRSSIRRVYGLITTAGGDDLGTLLVRNGLARAYGVSRALPDGTTAHEATQRLADWETGAMLKRAGVWSEADPESIVELRKEQRQEDRELDDLRAHVEAEEEADLVVDLNSATARELQSLAGIGPVLAARIISNRPYRTVNDLLKVDGINHLMFEKLEPHLTVADRAPAVK